MLLVKRIDVVEVDDDTVRILPSASTNCVSAVGTNAAVNRAEQVEMIRPTRFVRANGTTIVISWSQQVADTLGMPLEVIGNMQEALEEEKKVSLLYINMAAVQATTLLKISEANWWTRLLWLFIGVNTKEKVNAIKN